MAICFQEHWYLAAFDFFAFFQLIIIIIMHIITIPGKKNIWGDDKLIFLKVLPYDSSIIADIYRKLYLVDITISKSKLPLSFLSTLSFDGNTASMTYKELCNAFRTWAYGKACDGYLRIQNTCSTTTVYTAQIVRNRVYNVMQRLNALGLFQRVNDFEDEEEEEDVPSSPILKYEPIVEDDPISKDEPKTLITSEVREQVLEAAVAALTNLETPHGDIKDILQTVYDTLGIPVFPARTYYSDIIPETTSPMQQEDVVPFDLCNTSYAPFDFDPDKDHIFVCEGQRCIYKCESVMQMERELMNLSDIKIHDNIPEKYRMLVRFTDVEGKVGIACFDDTHWGAINHLDQFTTSDTKITISDIVYFPWKQHFENLAIAVVLPFESTDLSVYMQQVYALRKLMVPRTFSGAVIKTVLTMVYNRYSYSYGKSVSIKDMYIHYRNACGMKNGPIEFDAFCNVITYLGYMVVNNKVLNIADLSKVTSVAFPVIEKQNASRWNKIHNLQLRPDPPITIDTNVLPWQLSSHLPTL